MYLESIRLILIFNYFFWMIDKKFKVFMSLFFSLPHSYTMFIKYIEYKIESLKFTLYKQISFSQMC